MVRGIAVVAKREVRMLFTEKTLVIAVLIQLFVASFSAFLSVGFAVMFSPAALGPGLAEQLKIGVVGGGTETSESLIALMDDQLGVRRFAALQEAQAALQSGMVDGVMNIRDAPDESSRPVEAVQQLSNHQ